MLFFFTTKTAYEMRISDWSSDVCSSDLRSDCRALGVVEPAFGADQDRRRAGARTHRLQRGLAAGFVGEEQGAVGGPVCEQRGERHRVAKLGHGGAPALLGEIGRASCRERVCQYV